ncbi:hypothetical protein [Aestuariivivens sediminis]|uniref:hypothetical protein n=1 Tax=Aestuariivivens sediminis TaxID=2913557 RepID=UPI001F5A39F5|nr:hypothetical protein [Aestuariivivens sediminis]
MGRIQGGIGFGFFGGGAGQGEGQGARSQQALGKNNSLAKASSGPGLVRIHSLQL